MIWTSQRFQRWMVLFDLLLVQFRLFRGRHSFLVSCLECPNSLHVDLFNLQQSFYCAFQWTTGHLVLSSLGFIVETDLGLIDVCSVLASRDALLEFGHFVWLAMDQMVLLFSSRVFSRRNTSVEWFCLICCNYAIWPPRSLFLVPCFEIQIGRDSTTQ